jgi:hypothetical protein
LSRPQELSSLTMQQVVAAAHQFVQELAVVVPQKVPVPALAPAVRSPY